MGQGSVLRHPRDPDPWKQLLLSAVLAFRPRHTKGHLRLDPLSNYKHLEVHSNPAAASTTG